jgi:hypothetical protein
VVTGGDPVVVPGETRMTGVAATGAAFAGAAITVTDQTGTTVCTTTTAADGTYACTLPASTKAPLVIRATRDDVSLYSTTASTTGGTVNVTPLTTIIVSQLSPNGNPASLAGAIQTNPTSVTASTIQAQIADLVAALQPLLTALGQGAIDPIGGALVADGTGQDKLLDSISVSVLPDGTAANIEITVKGTPQASGEPLSLSYSTASTTTPVINPIPAGALDNTPTPAVVADLFKRLTACFALPLTQRVDTAANDTTATTGTAVNVTAPACRTLFVGDDPATFYNNGNHVGRDVNNAGAFTGLFRPGATGLVWDRGNFEFVRSNGDLVLSYRNIDSAGTVTNETIVARAVGGALKLTGNEYAYGASVRSIAEDRELVNSPNFSYYTTGYNVSIDNKVVNGNSIFGKVVVTPPNNGAPLTYVPQNGLSYLVATGTGTSIVRLAGQYGNAATAGNPSEKEPALYFVSPQRTDAEITALKNQSVWTLEFFDTNNASLATQTYRTLARAQSIAEIRQLAFAQLTPTMRAELISGSSANGYFDFGAPSLADPNTIDFSAEGDLDAWTVPTGALVPTGFTAYGRAPFGSTTPAVAGDRFNDSTGLASVARKAKVFCSVQSQGDKHCANAMTFPGQYAQGTSVNMFELSARNARQVDISKKVALYKLLP